ncbi:zeta toxin family protein (plasmid) [Streptomyces halstedii]|uniref:uridine kinase family protein n=1 Tax=Streptomyces halstedii TaxID=1944 RepID=UPI002F917E4D
MLLSAPPVPVLLIGGGAGSGKTTLATEVAQATPATQVVHLDHCFHTDADRAPVVPAINRAGVVINYSEPGAIDWQRVQDALDTAGRPGTQVLLVEGTFALLPTLTSLARWSVYVDTPADLRLARKTLRKISDGADPQISLRGYLAHGRDAHTRHVAPIQHTADLVLDGTQPTNHLTQQVHALLNTTADLTRP